MTKYFENEIIELKRELIDEVKSEIVAFLNSEGGTVYVGVEDDGTVVGFHDDKTKDTLDLKLGNWIQEAFFPKPSGLINYFFNKDDVLEIHISKGTNKPYYLREKGPKPSGVYIRVGRSKRKANEDEILRMIMKSHKYSYEEDASDEQELTFKSFSRTLEDNEMKLTTRLMNSLGFKTKSGEYTNLAYLLSDQSEIVVKVAEYDAHLNFKIKKSFKGSLVTILKNVEEQAERLNDLRVVIDGSSFKRKETKSYPGASLREMVLNAICHADYFIRSNIKIEFFPDKARITSPGGIFNASMDDIMNGIQTYRNPRLVHVFDKLGMIENFGTGIPRTIESYSNYDVKPEFKATENFFIVTLPNLNSIKNDSINDQINDQINGQINDQINDLGLTILQILNTKQGLRIPELILEIENKGIETTVDKVRNEIRRNLKKYVEHRGSNKTGGYYLKDWHSNRVE